MKKFIYTLLIVLFSISTIKAQTCLITKDGYTIPNNANLHVTNEPGGYLNDKIALAIQNGFTNINIGQGWFYVSSPIIVPAGVTIKGGGVTTYISPIVTATFPNIITSIFSVSTSGSVIKNMEIQTHNGYYDGAALCGIEILGGANNNVFENLYFGRSEGNTASTPPFIKFEIPSGEVTNNKFDKIHFFKSENGIEINVNGTGNFSNNSFNNIYLHHFDKGIFFTGSGGTIDNNVFTNIDAQCKAGPRSKDIIKDVRGNNNVFRNLNHAEWSPTDANNYVISITAGATGTIVEDFETALNPENDFTINNKYYLNHGTGTKFINGANSNRLNSLSLDKVNDFTYNGNSSDGSLFSVLDYEFINIKPKDNSSITNKVLTSIDLEGNVAWLSPNANVNTVTNQLNGSVLTTTVNDITSDGVNIAELNPTLYTANGTIKGTGSLEHNNRVIFMIDGHIAKSNFLKFTRDEHDASNVMYLHTTTRAVGNNDQNCVVIGANARANAELDNSLPDLSRYRLLVNGRVKIKEEFLLASTGWADYVFAKDYKLKPLKDIETYINEIGHLPNFPSAKSIETDGLPLASIKVKQQEKIEELTLYAIEQERKLEDQDKQFEILSNKIEELKKIINQFIDKNN